MQANVFEDSAALSGSIDTGEACSVHSSGTMSRGPSGHLPGTPHSSAPALPASLLEEWFRSASRVACGGQGIVARFSGFSMPTPSQLLPPSLRQPLWSAFGLRGGSQRLAGVDPDAAAALRRAVEGSVLQRSAGAHRSSPDLFSQSPSDPPQSSPDRASNVLRLKLRQQELRDDDGNRFCRSVHVTSGAGVRLRNPQGPATATPALPQSASRSICTSQLSDRSSSLPAQGVFEEGPGGGLAGALAEAGDGRPSVEGRVQPTAPLASRSINPAQTAIPASLGSADSGGALVSSHPYVPMHELSRALEQDGPARSPSVAAHPVDALSPASGDSTDKSHVQAPSTPSSTTNTDHSTLFEVPDGLNSTVPCHSPESDNFRRNPVATSGACAGGGASNSTHARKPPPCPRDQQGRRSGPGLQENIAFQKPGESKQPLVFLHGVGFGVLPYLGWVWKLLRAFPGALLCFIST